jgi:large subunit ribosomal protein L33
LCPQAKCLKVKLFSEANTGYFYTWKKNPKAYPWRIALRKYDPIVRKHVLFKVRHTPKLPARRAACHAQHCESGVAARVRCNNKHLCHQRAGCGPATSRIAFHDKHCCAQMQANLHTQYERASVVRASQPNSLSGRRFAQRSIQAAYPACESGEPRQHCCVHSTALRCRRTSCAVSPARLSPPWKQAAALKKLHGSLQTCRRSMHSTQLELVF